MSNKLTPIDLMIILAVLAIIFVIFFGKRNSPTENDPAKIPVEKAYQELEKRWKVESQGYFNAGSYYGNPREVLLITDTKTGATYLGITGVGISDISQHQSGKNTVHHEE